MEQFGAISSTITLSSLWAVKANELTVDFVSTFNIEYYSIGNWIHDVWICSGVVNSIPPFSPCWVKQRYQIAPAIRHQLRFHPSLTKLKRNLLIPQGLVSYCIALKLKLVWRRRLCWFLSITIPLNIDCSFRFLITLAYLWTIDYASNLGVAFHLHQYSLSCPLSLLAQPSTFSLFAITLLPFGTFTAPRNLGLSDCK